jgi:hypothetical protein
MKVLHFSMALAVFASIFTISTTSVDAQTAPPACKPRQEIVDTMINAGASPVVVAEMGENRLMEVWSDGKRWTAYVSTKTPEGPMTCPIAGGVGDVRAAPQICLHPARCPVI